MRIELVLPRRDTNCPGNIKILTLDNIYKYLYFRVFKESKELLGCRVMPVLL